MPKNIVLESVVICPACGQGKPEQMSLYTAKEIYVCDQCGQMLKTKADECCIFCAYGSVPCPTTQRKRLSR